MKDWPRGSIIGSLRRQIAKEVKEHLQTNPAIRSARLPFGMRMLRLFFGNRGLLGFLIPYTVLVALLVSAEIIVANFWPNLIPSWSINQNIGPLLKDVTSAFLGAQVVMVGLLFPIAVGLVTLIVQREEASSTVSDIQVYYGETLAYRIGASGIALSIVLAAQLLWPAQFAIHRLGFGTPSEFFKGIATVVHFLWLFINFSALWHFLLTSLNFMRPAERALLRRRFAANVSIPSNLTEILTTNFYANGGRFILGQMRTSDADDGQPSLIFGPGLDEWGEVEVAAPGTSEKILVDVWMRPLGWAIRNWLKRCQKQGPVDSQSASAPALVFLPGWRRPMRDDGIICLRSHGIPLGTLERFLIRQSFRFGKEGP